MTNGLWRRRWGELNSGPQALIAKEKPSLSSP